MIRIETKRAVVLAIVASVLVGIVAAQIVRHASLRRSNYAFATGQLDKSYSSLGELVRDSVAIVVGKAINSVPKAYGEVPFTVVEVRVEDAWKGPLSKGDVIRVLETGGLWKGYPKGPAANADPSAVSPREVAFDGVPVMKPGERYVLFLSRYEGPIIDSAFVPLGVFQGKLKIGADGTVEPNVVTSWGGADWRRDSEFRVLQSVVGLRITEIRGMVDRLLGP